MQPCGDDIAALCTLCRSEIYCGEPYYYINGTFICGDCLPDYAEQAFAPFLIREEDTP